MLCEANLTWANGGRERVTLSEKQIYQSVFLTGKHYVLRGKPVWNGCSCFSAIVRPNFIDVIPKTASHFSGWVFECPRILSENRFTLFGMGFWVPAHLVRKPFHTFRDRFWVPAHLIRKPFHTFRDAFWLPAHLIRKPFHTFRDARGMRCNKIIRPDWCRGCAAFGHGRFFQAIST